ncbi:MAG: biotin transporter BioY [Acutalibacteraceae bacterium]|jgi:biotin transport system substrate-specific component
MTPAAPSKTAKRILDMAYVAMFAALIAVCSWISIPTQVPFTLQTFAVFCAVGLLGGKRGTLAILVYLLLGAVGVPVFAGFSGGMGVLLGTTGGYLIGFLFTALAYWLIVKLLGKKWWSQLIAMAAGLIVCYTFGTAWFMIVYARTAGAIGLATALGWCVVPFILPDLLKIAAALFISVRVPRYVRIFD